MTINKSVPPRQQKRAISAISQKSPMSCSLATAHVIGNAFGKKMPSEKKMHTELNKRNLERHNKQFSTGKRGTGIPMPNVLHKYGMGAYEVPTTNSRDLINKVKNILKKDDEIPYLMGTNKKGHHVLPIHSTTKNELNIMDPEIGKIESIHFNADGTFTSNHKIYNATLYSARSTRRGDEISLDSNISTGNLPKKKKS